MPAVATTTAAPSESLWPPDRIAEHCRAALVDRRDRLEPDDSAIRSFEQTDTVSDQDRCDVDDDLVEEVMFEDLPGDVRAEQDNVAIAGRVLCDRHGVLYVEVQELSGDALDDRRLGRR